MKIIWIAKIVIVLLLFAVNSIAADQKVLMKIEGMTCNL